MRVVWFLLWVFISGVVLPLQITGQPRNGGAIARAIRGQVEYALSDQSSKVVGVGMRFRSGTTLRTAADSQIDLFLGPNGGSIRLCSNSVLLLKTLDLLNNGLEQIATTKIDLRSGRLLGRGKKLPSASLYEIQTASATIRIVEGDYDIRSEGVIELHAGRAQLTLGTNDGPVVPVQAGEAVRFPNSKATDVIKGGVTDESKQTLADFTVTSVSIIGCFQRIELSQEIGIEFPPAETIVSLDEFKTHPQGLLIILPRFAEDLLPPHREPFIDVPMSPFHGPL